MTHNCDGANGFCFYPGSIFEWLKLQRYNSTATSKCYNVSLNQTRGKNHDFPSKIPDAENDMHSISW